jgi:hypothetical protein
MENKKGYFQLTIDEKKEIFVKTLINTNRGFSFYVNWENAKAYKDFEIELHAMNSLIGIKEDIEFRVMFEKLLKKLPDVISIFPLLFALSKGERESLLKNKSKLEVLDDLDLEKDAISFQFSKKDSLSENEIDLYYTFFERMGLKHLFQDIIEKNVLDYVIGVLVGLDSNGRKNRGGKSFEDACEPIIAKICRKYNIELLTQKKFKELNEKGFKINHDISNRKADFILVKDDNVLNIEANFYFTSGSKPEEIIDSYSKREKDLSDNGIKFIYLTDGNGCWGNVDKNQLINGFKNITYFINFNMLKNDFFEEIIVKEFALNIK